MQPSHQGRSVPCLRRVPRSHPLPRRDRWRDAGAVASGGASGPKGAGDGKV